MKYATAIWPLAMNAAGRVYRPAMINAPATISITPARPRSETISAVRPPNIPKIFCSP